MISVSLNFMSAIRYARLMKDRTNYFLPVEKRLVIYKKMLESFETDSAEIFDIMNSRNEFSGFCGTLNFSISDPKIYDMVKDLYAEPYKTGVSMKMLPEIWCYKPWHFVSMYWFKLNRHNNERRKEIMRWAIKTCEKIIKEKNTV